MTKSREEWLAERKTGVGGSDAAAILGLSPWRTAVQVWMDKTGRSAPQPETEAMMLGTELEDFVARRYSMQTGRTVQRFSRTIHRGCLLGNIDRLVVPDGEKVASHMGEVRTDTLLECKTSSRAWEDDAVPLYYQTQVQHYMGLCPSVNHADVACLFIAPRKNFKVFRVDRDPAVIDFMQKRIKEWWAKYVESDTCPPPESEEDCKLIWQKSNPGRSVKADFSIGERVAELKRINEQIKNLELMQKEAKDAICAFMGDAEILEGMNGKPIVTWKSGNYTERTDWAQVAAQCGAPSDLIEQYTRRISGVRRFCLK